MPEMRTKLVRMMVATALFAFIATSNAWHWLSEQLCSDRKEHVSVVHKFTNTIFRQKICSLS
jgi:hypothetical protein